MTKEEAVKILSYYDMGFYDINGFPIPALMLAEACDMAIEALSAPTDGDLISRQAAIDALCKRCDIVNDVPCTEECNDIKILRKLPSTDRWIPCSERLPEKPYGCLVTVESSRFDGGEFVECESILPYFVGYDENDWYDDDGERCQYEVIAWMPLPEPYKGGADMRGDSDE